MLGPSSLGDNPLDRREALRVSEANVGAEVRDEADLQVAHERFRLALKPQLLANAEDRLRVVAHERR